MIGTLSILADLLAECDARDIRLAIAGDGGLTIDAPQDALTPGLLGRLKANKADLLAAIRPAPKRAPTLPVTVSDTPAKTTKAICRCGSTTWRDVVLNHAPHNGSTIRRDCAGCNRFLDFPVWYGKNAGRSDQHSIG